MSWNVSDACWKTRRDPKMVTGLGDGEILAEDQRSKMTKKGKRAYDKK